MCSQEELVHIQNGFLHDVRSDGRGTEELRSIVLETGQLVQASGSARLKLGLTDVLVAVKVRRLQISPTSARVMPLPVHLAQHNAANGTVASRLSLALPAQTGQTVAIFSLLLSVPLVLILSFRYVSGLALLLDSIRMQKPLPIDKLKYSGTYCMIPGARRR